MGNLLPHGFAADPAVVVASAVAAAVVADCGADVVAVAVGHYLSMGYVCSVEENSF